MVKMVQRMKKERNSQKSNASITPDDGKKTGGPCFSQLGPCKLRMGRSKRSASAAAAVVLMASYGSTGQIEGSNCNAFVRAEGINRLSKDGSEYRRSATQISSGGAKRIRSSIHNHVVSGLRSTQGGTVDVGDGGKDVEVVIDGGIPDASQKCDSAAQSDPTPQGSVAETPAETAALTASASASEPTGSAPAPAASPVAAQAASPVTAQAASPVTAPAQSETSPDEDAGEEDIVSFVNRQSETSPDGDTGEDLVSFVKRRLSGDFSDVLSTAALATPATPPAESAAAEDAVPAPAEEAEDAVPTAPAVAAAAVASEAVPAPPAETDSAALEPVTAAGCSAPASEAVPAPAEAAAAPAPETGSAATAAPAETAPAASKPAGAAPTPSPGAPVLVLPLSGQEDGKGFQPAHKDDECVEEPAHQGGKGVVQPALQGGEDESKEDPDGGQQRKKQHEVSLSRSMSRTSSIAISIGQAAEKVRGNTIFFFF